jgi:hypothetical protein
MTVVPIPISILLYFYQLITIEWIPIKWFQYDHGAWKSVTKPNRGRYRDVPPGAVFHRSVIDRLKMDAEYRPLNRTFTKSTALPVELGLISTRILDKEEDDAEASIRSVDDDTRSLRSKQSNQVSTHFELYSTFERRIGQTEEDQTYRASEGPYPV